MPEVIKSLLRSRKFVASLAAILAVIVVMVVPAMEPYQEFLTNSIIALAGLLVGTWGLEDFAAKIKGSTIPQDVEEVLIVLQDIVKALAERDAILSEREATPPADDPPFNG